MELLTRIKELARGKRAAVLTGYHDAVAAVAAGKKTDPEKVAAVLDQAGIDPEKFEADVQACAERLRLRAVADRMPEAEKKRADAQRKIDELEAKLEEAINTIREQAAPFHQQVRESEQAMDAARNAEDELRRSYPADGPARAELADAVRRATAADQRRTDLRDMIQRAEATIREATASPNHYQPDVAPNAEKRLARYRADLDQADAEFRAAVDAQAAATQRMTQP